MVLTLKQFNLVYTYLHNIYIFSSIFTSSHFIFTYFHLFSPVATLGSILDSQPSWKSGKLQLARWSHELVLFSVETGLPSTRPPQFLTRRKVSTCLNFYLVYIGCSEGDQKVSGGCLEGVCVCWKVSTTAWKMEPRCNNIATLGSILDSQLSWESGKF